MLKFVIIGITLTIVYTSYASLMKAAGKKTPEIPDINPKEDKDN